MGIFDGDKEKVKPPVNNNTGNENITELANEIKQHKKRGRKSNAEKGIVSGVKKNVSALSDTQIKEVEAILNPESFKNLVKLPASTMLAITGNELWELPETDVEVLAQNASVASKYFLQTDPKWIALTMLLVNVAMIYGTRTMLYLEQKKEKKKLVEVKKDEENNTTA